MTQSPENAVKNIAEESGKCATIIESPVVISKPAQRSQQRGVFLRKDLIKQMIEEKKQTKQMRESIAIALSVTASTKAVEKGRAVSCLTKAKF